MKTHLFLSSTILLSMLFLSGCGKSSNTLSDKSLEQETSAVQVKPSALFSESSTVHSTTLTPKLSSEGNTTSEESVKAFFGDKENNKVIIVDIENMEQLYASENYTGHEITYTVANLKIVPKLYVSNRGSNAIDVIDAESMHITKTITLQHFPRSADALNEKLGLVAVSGMNKPMISIIDIYTDQVVAVVGDDIVTAPVDSANGTHACGHPYWLNENHFVLIDRARKRLTTYKICKNEKNEWVTKKLNTICTSTTAHHLVPRENYMGKMDRYYLINEGSDTEYPSVRELVFEEGVGLKRCSKVCLVNKDVSIPQMGAHHGDFVANDTLLYVGSKEGVMFVVDYDTMKVKSMLLAGKGAGHTMMVPERDLAITINHKDKFITLYDTKCSHFIKNIEVSDLPDSEVGKTTIQAHPEYFVSEDAKYFYMFLTEEARFVKVDLDLMEVVDSLYVGGKPAMGTFR
jgi:YVTN family beta-propeller protein